MFFRDSRLYRVYRLRNVQRGHPRRKNCEPHHQGQFLLHGIFRAIPERRRQSRCRSCHKNATPYLPEACSESAATYKGNVGNCPRESLAMQAPTSVYDQTHAAFSGYTYMAAEFAVWNVSKNARFDFGAGIEFVTAGGNAMKVDPCCIPLRGTWRREQPIRRPYGSPDIASATDRDGATVRQITRDKNERQRGIKYHEFHKEVPGLQTTLESTPQVRHRTEGRLHEPPSRAMELQTH